MFSHTQYSIKLINIPKTRFKNIFSFTVSKFLCIFCYIYIYKKHSQTRKKKKKKKQPLILFLHGIYSFRKK